MQTIHNFLPDNKWYHLPLYRDREDKDTDGDGVKDCRDDDDDNDGIPDNQDPDR